MVFSPWPLFIQFMSITDTVIRTSLPDISLTVLVAWINVGWTCCIIYHCRAMTMKTKDQNATTVLLVYLRTDFHCFQASGWYHYIHNTRDLLKEIVAQTGCYGGITNPITEDPWWSQPNRWRYVFSREILNTAFGYGVSYDFSYSGTTPCLSYWD